MRTVGVEGMYIDAGGRSGILEHDLEDLADFGRKGTGDGVDATVGYGTVVVGEIGAVVFVQGDEIRFLGEGVDPGVVILRPDRFAALNHLLNSDHDTARDL